MKDFSTVRFYKVSYGNFLDNYYVEDYDSFIEYLLTAFQDTLEQKVNLGITDGVTIINNFKGDFAEYNCAIVDKYGDGKYDLYKITERQFIRQNIWRLTLVLDVFSKYYNDVIISQCLVERLGIKDYGSFDPILFNDEGFTFSAIKKKQIALPFVCEDNPLSKITNLNYDATKIKGKLVFIKASAWDSATNLTASITDYSNIDETVYDISSLDAFPLQAGENLINNFRWKIPTDNAIGAGLFYIWRSYYKKAIDFYKGTYDASVGKTSYINTTAVSKATYNNHGFYMTVDSTNYEYDEPSLSASQFTSNMNVLLNRDVILDKKQYSDYSQYNERLLHTQNDNKYYRVHLYKQSDLEDEINIYSHDDLTTLFGTDAYSHGNRKRNGLIIDYSYEQYIVQFEEVSMTAGNFEVSISRKRATDDEGYVILWLPDVSGVNQSYWECTDNGHRLYIDFTIQNKLLNKLRENYSQSIIDIQETYIDMRENRKSTHLSIRLAYCINYILSTDEQDEIADIEANGKGSFNSEEIIAVVDATGTDVVKCDFFAYAFRSSVGERELDLNIDVDDFKLEQSKQYILRSPTGKTTHEFSVAKNIGLTGFKLKYSLRPFASMYQIQPYYKGYYGENFTDIRGLVVTEDLSLTQNTDVLEQYKRENVNYVNSFNSNQNYEISQLNLKQQYERQEFIINTLTGIGNDALDTAGNMTQLASFSSSIGNGINAGSIAGMSIGGELMGDAIETGLNYWTLMRQQEHERNLLANSQKESRKQWHYNLGNMGARPTNLDKVSGIYNTDYGWFVLEVYEPTQYEQTTYLDYLDLYGIKIGKVIYLYNYDFDYVSGTVVIFNGVITREEYEELNNEMNSGRRKYTDYDIIDEGE